MSAENSLSRIRLITRIIAAACLISMLLCYKLWLDDRPFPLSPVSSKLPALSYPFDLVLFSAAGICLLLIILLPRPKKLIISFLVIAFLLAILDQNRWQPWFYQYCLMFLVLAPYGFLNDSRYQSAILVTFKLMMAAVYIWSGL